MRILAKYGLGFKEQYELQVMDDDGIWLRLTREPKRDNLAFWSANGPVEPQGWVSVAQALDKALSTIPVSDRAAIDRACEIWAEGWEFWGPNVPSPLAETVAPGRIDADAAQCNRSSLRSA